MPFRDTDFLIQEYAHVFLTAVFAGYIKIKKTLNNVTCMEKLKFSTKELFFFELFEATKLLT